MSWAYKDGHYISDGTLFYANDQSANEQNFVLADPGVRVVFLYNGSGAMYYCAAMPGERSFVFAVYHTNRAGGEPQYEGSPPKQIMQYRGMTVTYAGHSWSSPPPILAPGVEVHPFGGSEAERTATALYWLFHYVYDKPSFLAGLAVGRALWRPPEVLT